MGKVLCSFRIDQRNLNWFLKGVSERKCSRSYSFEASRRREHSKRCTFNHFVDSFEWILFFASQKTFLDFQFLFLWTVLSAATPDWFTLLRKDSMKLSIFCWKSMELMSISAAAEWVNSPLSFHFLNEKSTDWRKSNNLFHRFWILLRRTKY